MFEFVKIIINPEHEEYVKEILEKHEDEIRSLLEDLTKNLGEGNTADVRFLRSNEKICLKIYKQPDQIKEGIFYLKPEKEEEFLEGLKDLGAKVRIPKVYASFEITNDADSQNNHQFLMMEALPAVSVDDILQDRAKIPKNFDWVTFQNDLLDFVEKMHERNVYHRDLHEGNIMIDKETLQAYVIDFGASVEFWGHAEPGERGPYHITKDGRERILTSDEAMVIQVVKKLKTKLTEMN
jgi:serine/threonine protein kinase